MITQNMKDYPCWYLVHTHPKQEQRAETNLKAWNVETLAPKFRDKRYNEFTDKPTFMIKPLFPRYIFVRFNLYRLYHKVRFTRGIENLVSFGSGPTPVSEEIIQLIESKINKDGFVRFHEALKPEDKVIIKHGSLRDLAGVVEREMPASDRVQILLTTVGFQAHVVLEREFVQKDQ
jgi:transcriptional antiterminator RfaH